MSKVAVIQGCSRGIGLALTKHLLQTNPTSVVFGTCRNPIELAKNQPELQSQFPGRFHLVQLDVTKEEEIEKASQTIKERVDGIDLLVNSAGIMSPDGIGETTFRKVTQEALLQTFSVNAAGPLLVVKHFGDLLQAGKGGFGASNATPKHKSIVVNISAKVASMTKNDLGGWYSYRISKTALNMATNTLSIELKRKGIICVALHPGSVETDMTRRYLKSIPADQLLTKDHAAQQFFQFVNLLSLEKTGQFLFPDGKEIPW